MEKWSQQRIDAYIRYIEEDERELRSSQRSLDAGIEQVKNACKQIARYERAISDIKKELAEQGIKIDEKKNAHRLG